MEVLEGKSRRVVAHVPKDNDYGEMSRLIKDHARQVSRLQDQIHDLSALNERTIHSIPLLLLFVDKDLRVVRANRTYLNTVNKKKIEVIGRRIHEVFPGSLFPEHDLTDKMKKVLECGETLRLTDIRDESSTHPLQYMHITLARICRTREDHLIIMIEDMTEHKNLKLQLQQAQKMETIETLAGGIAHNFNNILMGIQGYVSLMLIDMEPGHPFHSKLTKIEERVEKGADLTQKLLGFANEREFDPAPAELNDLLLRSIAIFGGIRKGIKIDTSLQEDIPMVLIDSCQIEEVLLNIYINAWHAMPHGGNLRIETSTTFADQAHLSDGGLRPGEYVRVSLTDTGVGMDQDTERRVFEPFFTTKDIGKGTGLGLAAAHGIIKNHKGLITVSSELGRGTSFHIYLPVTKEPAPEKPELSDKIVRGSGTILLVDDEEVILDIGAETLGLLGYTVLKARDGKEAVSTYQNNKDSISLVVLDIIMPNMGGKEVFGRIKAIKPDAKVLLASGFSMDGEAEELIREGANGFLQKPYGIKAVSHKIAEIINGN